MARAEDCRPVNHKERYAQHIRAMRQDAMSLAFYGHYEDAERMLKLLIEDHLDLCKRCPCLLSNLGELYVSMLKLDEALDTAERLVRCAGQWNAARCRNLGDKIRRLVGVCKSASLWTYGTAVQLDSPCDGLSGKIGMIGGMNTPEDAPRRGSARYRVVVGGAHAWVRPANLCLATVIVQLSVVQVSGAWRVRGFMLSGDECADYVTDRSDLTAVAVRRELALRMGCEPLVISIVLPGGESLTDGDRGDAALLRSAQSDTTSDVANKNHMESTVGTTLREATGSAAEDSREVNEPHVEDAPEVYEAEGHAEQQGAQCSGTPARSTLAVTKTENAGEASGMDSEQVEDADESDWMLVGISDVSESDTDEEDADNDDDDLTETYPTDSESESVDPVDEIVDTASETRIRDWGAGALEAAAVTVGKWLKALCQQKKRAFTKRELKEFLETLPPSVAGMRGMAAAASVAATRGRLGRLQISEVARGLATDVQTLLEVRARYTYACAKSARSALGAPGSPGEAEKA